MCLRKKSSDERERRVSPFRSCPEIILFRCNKNHSSLSTREIGPPNSTMLCCRRSIGAKSRAFHNGKGRPPTIRNSTRQVSSSTTYYTAALTTGVAFDLLYWHHKTNRTVYLALFHTAPISNHLSSTLWRSVSFKRCGRSYSCGYNTRCAAASAS